jgi:replicative DNA helicase
MTNETQDTLKKFGASFQIKCLAGVLTDKGFLEQIMDIIHVDFFENESHKWVLETILSYFHTYKDIPTMDVFKHKLNDISDSVTKEAIVNQLRLVYTKSNDNDLMYIKEQFLEFCKNQKLKSAILESADLLKSGEYEKIKHAVDEALKAGMERDDGHDYLTEIEKRLNEDARDTVKTNWKCVDELMDGGLGPGELGVVCGSAGSGKSWNLIKLGVEALKQGKNVVHFTLELQQNYVGRRYDCCFTGIDFQDISNNKDKVENALADLTGFLKIKYFPIKTVSALSLKNYIERIQTLTGKTVDMMIVDYADILRPGSAERNSNSYSEAGSIYEELRGAAGELQIPCWTASQTNRSSASEDVIEAGSISDSFRKIMTADFVMSASRKTEDKLTNTARFHVIKNRFGADGVTFNAHFDASCGDIKIYSRDDDEFKELQQKMKSGDDAVKTKLNNIWSKVKDENSEDDDLG